MNRVHRLCAVLALAGGALAVVAASPQAPLGSDEVSATELAQWLHQRRAGLQLVDLRSDTTADALPGAQPAVHANGTALGMVVVYAERDLSATTLVALRQQAGVTAADYRRLRGGVAAWQREVLYPVLRANASPAQRQQFLERAALSRYFGGSPRQLAPGEAPDTHRSRRGC